MTPIRRVLFDFDGTLVDTLPAVIESYRYACAELLGIEFPASLSDRRRVLMTRFMDLCAEIGGTDAPELVRMFRVRYLGDLQTPPAAFGGVPELLDGLVERDVAIAIVTNKTRVGLEADLARTALRDITFGAIVCAEDSVERKPDPTPLRIALTRLGGAAQDALYVGDGPHDIEAAHAAGMLGVGALYGDFGADALRVAAPEALLERPLDLLDLVDARSTAGR